MNEWNLEQGYPEIAMGIGIPIRKEITNHHFKWWSDKPYKGDCVAALKGRSRKPVTWLPLERVNRSLS